MWIGPLLPLRLTQVCIYKISGVCKLWPRCAGTHAWSTPSPSSFMQQMQNVGNGKNCTHVNCASLKLKYLLCWPGMQYVFTGMHTYLSGMHYHQTWPTSSVHMPCFVVWVHGPCAQCSAHRLGSIHCLSFII